MRNVFAVLACSFLISNFAMAFNISDRETHFETIVVCGTGDVIAGANIIYGDSGKLYLSILSQDDQQPPKNYYTDAPATVVSEIRAGKMLTITFRSDESVDFGGETTHAAFMELEAHQDHSFNYNSVLAEGGGVIDLYCNLKNSR